MSNISPETPESARPVTLDPVWVEACQALDYGDKPKHRFMRDIAADIARRYGLTLADLKSADRSQRISPVRREAMVACFAVNRNYSAVGRLFNREHSTVMYHIRTAHAPPCT